MNSKKKMLSMMTSPTPPRDSETMGGLVDWRVTDILDIFLWF